MHKVMSFHYTLTDPSGKTIDSSAGGEPLSFMVGNGQIIPALEVELQKLKIGEKKKVQLKAAQAYGIRDPKKVTEVPVAKMPKQKLKVGDRFRTSHDADADIVTVTKITSSHVTLDANHALAGIDRTFAVEVTGIRDATKEEIEHGHVHGPGGH